MRSKTSIKTSSSLTEEPMTLIALATYDERIIKEQAMLLNRLNGETNFIVKVDETGASYHVAIDHDGHIKIFRDRSRQI